MYINKFIHTADLHLGFKYKNKTLGARSDERKNELFITFERLINYANDNKIDLIIISGDFFERDALTYTETKHLMKIIDSYYGKIVLSCGNHDYYTDDYLFSNFTENLYVFKTDTLERVDIGENVCVYGASWLSDQESAFAIKRVELDHNKYNIAALHGDINDGKYKVDISPLVYSGFNYIALGHIHKKGKVLDGAYYSGSLEPLDFKELGEHGFYEVDIIQGSVNFVSFAQREFIIKDIFINKEDDFEDILGKFEAITDKDKNFYRINLKGTIQSDLNINRILSLIKGKFYYLEVINDLSEISNISDEIYQKIVKKAEAYPEDIRKEAIKIALKAMQSTENYYED
ncbi:metallophosphoesterase family protein [Fenollaria sporofastidiosus]|uniref:metallophosphoesterase family protein n=1 Tax=Fenollaria sporofastidiosus TaxID=2811778 RepID=UPI001C002A08|nr:DNA repair exonuclease [Fenollaria sporofastidiosus]